MTTTSTTFPGFLPGGSGIPSGGTYGPMTTPNGGAGSIISSGGLTSALSTLVQVLAVLSMAGLIGILIIAVVASRSEPDPTGRRPQSVYFFVVSFVTLTTTIFGSALVVGAILLLTANPSDSAGHALDRLLLLSALVTLVGLVLFAVHVRRGLDLARAESPWAGPSTRVGQTYVSVVAFVAILVVLVASILSLYVVFALAAPGTFGSFGGSRWAVRILVESAYLALVAAFVVWRHSSLLAPGLSLLRAGVGPVAPGGAAPPGPLPGQPGGGGGVAPPGGLPGF